MINSGGKSLILAMPCWMKLVEAGVSALSWVGRGASGVLKAWELEGEDECESTTVVYIHFLSVFLSVPNVVCSRS